MDEAGGGTVPDSVFTDDASVSEAADVSGTDVDGLGDYARGRRSTEDCAAVRYGYFGTFQRNERGVRHDHGNQSHPRRGEKVTEGQCESE